MAVLNREECARAIRSQKQAPCWLLYSADEYLLTSMTARLAKAMAEEEGEEPTVLPGPVPEIGYAVEAAGAISLFGNRRVVILSHMDPNAMPAADVELLAELCGELESAVLIFTVLVKDPPVRFGKKDPIKLPAAAKKLQAAVEKHGVVAGLEKPNEGSAKEFLIRYAEELGAVLEPGAAAELVERCGVDLLLLRAECEKLAAASGYGTIDRQLVRQMATRSMEADVFELSKLILSGKAAAAFRLLDELFYLQNDPLLITGALVGTYLDMYRVKCGKEAGLDHKQVFKELKYTGSDYRLKKSSEAAGSRSAAQLADCLEVLSRLDRKLKGSSVDRQELVRLAVGELLLLAKKRR